MEDKTIIELYFRRNEKAIAASDEKYGAYCFAVANNILENKEDSEECVNDTWLRAWESIPPAKPSVLRLFFARITRNLAIDRFEKNSALKRSGFSVVLDELQECIPSPGDVESEYSSKELGAAITAFLSSLSARERNIFIGRYYFGRSVKQISSEHLMREDNVYSVLSRTRKKLKAYLTEKGFNL